MLLAAVPFLSSWTQGFAPAGPVKSFRCISFALLFIGCRCFAFAARFRAVHLASVAACFNEARIISGAGYAFPGRYGVSLCFSGAVRCSRLPCHVTQCLCRANSCCAQQSLCFAIIAINASPSLRGEMPYLCVANRGGRYACAHSALPSPRLSKLSPCCAS